MPEGVYDEYSERGESENRNKELKCELCADRLSDHPRCWTIAIERLVALPLDRSSPRHLFLTTPTHGGKRGLCAQLIRYAKHRQPDSKDAALPGPHE